MGIRTRSISCLLESLSNKNVNATIPHGVMGNGSLSFRGRSYLLVNAIEGYSILSRYVRDSPSSTFLNNTTELLWKAKLSLFDSLNQSEGKRCSIYCSEIN